MAARQGLKVAVVALGKIGLPLAVQYAGKGADVVGVDVNEHLVADVANGIEPFPGEAGLGPQLREVVDQGRLRATTDFAAAIPAADVVVVVVPLAIDEQTGKPGFGAMDSATASIAEHLSPDTLISYETTLPVGTTRQRWKPMLEAGSGMREGHDFHVAFSPERVLTGRVFADLRKYPKLIGGLTAEGAARAAAFYQAVLDFDPRDDLKRPNGVWDLGSAEAAELAKLAETTYRDVNIALANQFAIYAATAGIDVHQVIEAANSQPYSHIHRPGIAVGGHCIPVYPRLYLATDPDASVVTAARAANAAMPEYAVARLEDLYGDLTGARVVVLGAAYRGGVKETALSGAYPTRDALEARGAKVRVHDPLYEDAELQALGFGPYTLGDAADAAIIQTDHDLYRSLGSEDLPGIRALVDGRRITDAARWQNVSRHVI